MQYKQQWGDMTVSECMGDKSRSRILKTLQFGKTHSRYTIEKSIEVIDACHDHALYKQFGGTGLKNFLICLISCR